MAQDETKFRILAAMNDKAKFDKLMAPVLQREPAPKPRRVVTDAELVTEVRSVADPAVSAEFDDSDLVRYSTEYIDEKQPFLAAIVMTIEHMIDRLAKRDAAAADATNRLHAWADDPVGRALEAEGKTRRG